MRRLAATVIVSCLAGCALTAPSPDRSAATGPGRVELSGVPFFPQDAYQCGPAALAAVLADSGLAVTPEALVSQVYVPGRRGSLQAELIAATRRHGRVPVRLPADSASDAASIETELRAGRPVLVLQNLGLSWLPRWHYAVVVGFDPERRTWLLRSGKRERVEWPDAGFQATWERAGRWAMVAADPERIPASVAAVDWIAAAAPFEVLGDFDVARTAYEAATRRWPDSALSWQATANLRYRSGDLAGAEQALRRALAAEPGAATRNNLAQILAERGCRDAALAQLDAIGEPPDALHEAVADTRRQAEALKAPAAAACPP